jgi:hypothetical protein
MKKFLKENFSMVSKIWANHFGMMVFGLMVSVAAGMLSKQFWGGNRIAQIIAGAFAVLLYMFLLYTALWEKGASDKIKIDGGRLEKNKLYGMYVSIYANAIFIFIGLLIVLFYHVGLRDASGVLSVITSFLNGMYSVFTGMCPEWFPYIHIIVQIPSIIVCTFSYLLGINGVRYILPETKKHLNDQTR